jgi:hypothetical protein
MLIKCYPLTRMLVSRFAHQCPPDQRCWSCVIACTTNYLGTQSYHIPIVFPRQGIFSSKNCWLGSKVRRTQTKLTVIGLHLPCSEMASNRTSPSGPSLCTMRLLDSGPDADLDQSWRKSMIMAERPSLRRGKRHGLAGQISGGQEGQGVKHKVIQLCG